MVTYDIDVVVNAVSRSSGQKCSVRLVKRSFDIIDGKAENFYLGCLVGALYVKYYPVSYSNGIFYIEDVTLFNYKEN